MKILKFDDPGGLQYISASADRKLDTMLRKHYGFKTNEQLWAWMSEHTELFTVGDVDMEQLYYDLGCDGKIDRTEVIHTDAQIREAFEGIVIFFEESIADDIRSRPA